MRAEPCMKFDMQYMRYGVQFPTISLIYGNSLGLVKFGDGTGVKSDLVGSEVTLSPDKHSYNVSCQLSGNMIWQQRLLLLLLAVTEVSKP